MGTIGNWVHAASYGVFWALCWWVWDMGQKPYPELRRSAAGCLLTGFAFGLWETFGWRAFRFPILFVIVPAAILGLLLGWSARSKLSADPAQRTEQ
jgi:hypothetical protein